MPLLGLVLGATGCVVGLVGVLDGCGVLDASLSWSLRVLLICLKGFILMKVTGLARICQKPIFKTGDFFAVARIALNGQ